MTRQSARCGEHIRRHVFGACPECGTSTNLGPGPLNAAETIEFRTCDDGHTVESEPTFWAMPGEATEFDIF